MDKSVSSRYRFGFSQLYYFYFSFGMDYAGYRNDNRKFQLSFVSFEALTEIETEDGVMCLDAPDDISDFESFLVNEEFKSFILELDKADERFGKILEMLSIGHTKNEVIESLDLKKSQGYHLIKKALEALEIFYK